MAGSSVTITHSTTGFSKSVIFTWVSDDTTGGASGTTTFAMDGQINNLVTNPGATAPTDNYDIVIEDSNGIDILQGVGADRDTANSEMAAVIFSGTSLTPILRSALKFKVDNAGNSKEGVATLYYVGKA